MKPSANSKAGGSRHDPNDPSNAYKGITAEHAENAEKTRKIVFLV
jgi:hypothetical protein